MQKSRRRRLYTPLDYYRYNEAGVIDWSSGDIRISVDDAEGKDISGDGMNDLLYTSREYKRDGLEHVVYLTFISGFGKTDGAATKGNVGMYSVIPEFYRRGDYPNNVMGVNPQGQFIITESQDGASRAVGVRGAQYGDIVIATKEGVDGTARYGFIKNGAAYRGNISRAVDIDDSDSIQQVPFDGNWIQPNVERSAGSAVYDGSDASSINIEDVTFSETEVRQLNSPESGEKTAIEDYDAAPYFAAEQFNDIATPQALLDLLPDELKSNSGDVIVDLNRVLDKPLNEVIIAVLADTRNNFSDYFKAMADNLIADLVNSIENIDGSHYARVSAVRSFLAEAFPANCPAAASTTVPEMFPLMSVSFSSIEDPNEDLSRAVRSAQSAFDELKGSGARAAMPGYTTYANQRNSITNQFNSQYTRIATVSVLQLIAAIPSKKSKVDALMNSFNNVDFSLTIGLYGSITNYWGKIELGVGAALLVNAEADSPRAGYRNYDPNDGHLGSDLSLQQKLFDSNIVVGPVLLSVDIIGDLGLMIDCGITSGDLYAGFIGLYGGRAWVGADYGIGWNYYKVWFIKIWYPCPYFNVYARGEKVSEQAYYFGPKTTNSASIQGNFTLTPYVSLTPRLTLWSSIYGQIQSIASLPGKLTVTAPPLRGDLDIALGLDIIAGAGIKFDFGIYTYNHLFNTWTLYTWKHTIYQGQVF